MIMRNGKQIYNRDDEQRKAVNGFLESKRLILNWATGVGKSKVAVEAMERLYDIGRRNILILVEERANIGTWEDEIMKWSRRIVGVNIYCYASLHKLENTCWDCIIMDEAHHIGSEKRLRSLKKIKSDYILCLSATIGDEIEDSLQVIYGKFSKLNIGLGAAINRGYLRRPKIYCIGLNLSEDKEMELVLNPNRGGEVRDIFDNRWKYTTAKNRVVLRCNEKQYYQYIEEEMSRLKSRFYASQTDLNKIKWLSEGSKRKKFMGEQKTEYVKRLIGNLRDSRFICFCNSIEQCDEIGGENSLHSKCKDKDILRKFNDGEIDSIYAVEMLTEGVNLSSLDCGIIVQLDGKSRLFIQKMGRMFRGENPKIYIFYFKDTQDEKYLTKCLENIDRKYVTYLDFSKI